MESIAELRTICQTTAKKDVSNVYMRYVSRFFSIFITRFLIPTKITADQVSFIMIITGVIANLIFLLPNVWSFLLGSLMLQLWYVLDCADGEVARYRRYQDKGEMIKEKIDMPMTGAYWDYLNHYIVHSLVPLTVSFGLFQASRNAGWLLLGFVASLFQTMLLVVHDVKSRAFIEKIKKLARTHWVGLNTAQSESESSASKKWSVFKWIFVAVHYSVTFPTVMNVATLLALLSIIGIGGHYFDLRKLFLAYYAAASLAVFLGLAHRNLSNQGLDHEFEGIFTFEKRI